MFSHFPYTPQNYTPSTMINATGEAMHLYVPQEMDLPGYAPNTINGPLLVSYFVAGNGAIATIAYTFLSRVNPSLSRNDMLGSLWFTLCGFIHFFFEGGSSIGSHFLLHTC
jgi:cholestenol delta-isomerase